MTKRLPHDAFSYYVSLGAERSYSAVAAQYGVSKRAVTRKAVEEQWQQRAAEMEAQARKKADEKMQETLEEMHVRHLKLLRVIQTKALETLRDQPLSKAIEAVRALELCIREERATRGATDEDGEVEAPLRALNVITSVDEPNA
jgi:Zn-dependent peptidase ImmA (M78 family)